MLVAGGVRVLGKVVKSGSSRTPMRVAEVAWILNELIAVATILKGRGRCLGELYWHHIEITVGGVQKKSESAVFMKIFDLVSSFIHERFLHDEGCHALGISKRVIFSLVRKKVSVQNRELVFEAVVEAIDEINSNVDNNLIEREVFELFMSSKISLQKPILTVLKRR